jgi:hypothetical protein
MLAVGDTLLMEFSHLPLLDVVTAINEARRALAVQAGHDLDPDVIAREARARLTALTSMTA